MSPRRHIERIEDAGTATLQGVARSVREYRSRALALIKRHPARLTVPISIRVLRAGKMQGPSADAFAEAWQDLQEHPALLWIPPVWRAENVDAAHHNVVARHVVRAVDRNLKVQVDPDAADELRVLLATGPLRDRQVGSAIDPTNPSGTVDPDLNVSAPTFEEAVIRLRNAVVHAYGPVPSSRTSPDPHCDAPRSVAHSTGGWAQHTDHGPDEDYEGGVGVSPHHQRIGWKVPLRQ